MKLKGKINSIYRNWNKKDGTPYQTSKGVKFEKVDVLVDADCVDHPQFEGRATYFDYNGDTENWTEGMEIDVEVDTSESNGRTYFNIKRESANEKSSRLESRLAELEKRVEVLESAEKEEPEEGSDPIKELPF